VYHRRRPALQRLPPRPGLTRTLGITEHPFALMAAFARSTAALRFFGEDLDPSELTSLLGCQPTLQYRKGDLISPGRENIRKYGGWVLRVEDREPKAIDDQLSSIFAKLTQDVDVWQTVTTRFDADVFCGLFMAESNEGFSLSTSTLAALTARNLDIEFDVYDPSDEQQEPTPSGDA
jgi:hypothetical protein